VRSAPQQSGPIDHRCRDDPGNPAMSAPSTAVKAKGAAVSSNAEILATSVPWPSFQSAGIITTEQLELIYALDKKPMDAQVAAFSQAASSYVTLFSTLVAGVSKDESLMYVLVLVDKLFDAKPKLIGSFHTAFFESDGAVDPFKPFMKLLSRSSSSVLEKATAVVSKLLSYAHYLLVGSAAAESILSGYVSSYAEFLINAVKAIDPGLNEAPKVSYALSGLQSFLGSDPGRKAVVVADGLPALFGLMSSYAQTSHSAVQLIYQVVFCLWSLSYSTVASLAMVTTKIGLVAKLVDIVKTVQKEKVVRVAIATLKNLLPVATAASDMVGAGLVKALEHLQQRKWADEDIVADLTVLAEALQVNVQGMSSWDVYAKEVASGKLEWSPSHKSDNFWKNNYHAFEAHDFAICKQLVALLSSPDPQTLAVACYDIAEFIKTHPEGRRIMTQEGSKQPAMALLKHSDPEVQKYSLTAVQRLMVINWEFLHK